MWVLLLSLLIVILFSIFAIGTMISIGVGRGIAAMFKEYNKLPLPPSRDNRISFENNVDSYIKLINNIKKEN